MNDASAMMMPMRPTMAPNSPATTPGVSASGTAGASTATSIAPTRSARNAWSRRRTMRPMTTIIDTASVRSGLMASQAGTDTDAGRRMPAGASGTGARPDQVRIRFQLARQRSARCICSSTGPASCSIR